MTAHLRPALDSIPAYVPGRTVPGAVKLASNETVDGPLPSVVSAIADAAATVNRYPDDTASALVADLAASLGVAPDRIAVGCGSVTLCQDLVHATAGPGDEVVFAWRSFEAYPIITSIAGATSVAVPNTPEHGHDLDAMLAAITDRTRLVFVCNPNNPTGSVLDADELTRFLDAVPSTVTVALDEAYFEYVRMPEGLPRPDGVALTADRPNVVALRTFSKAYGLAGLRVGYAVGAPPLIAALNKVHTPFSVSTVAQAAARASLAEASTLLARTDLVVAERERVRSALLEAGFDVPPSAANFVWLPLGEASAGFADAAADAKLLVRRYGDDGVRVTITTPAENDAFLDVAMAYAARTTPEL